MKIENYRDVEFIRDLPLSYVRKGDKGATVEVFPEHYLIEVTDPQGDVDLVNADDNDVTEII